MRDSPFHIVNCLKSFDLTLFFVCTLINVKGPMGVRRNFAKGGNVDI